ncbi:MAG: ABC transporter permease [Clostridia bacterium]|nr:ABC transporter permease [Clostridia bacterium]
MYIIKNALRSISRAKGRNILIGIIALAIAISACVALSIKESASKAREDTLNLMNITAQISMDRQSMMQGAMGQPSDDGEKPSFDRDAMKEMLQGGSELSLDEYQTYAAAESVKDSYYSLSVTLDASGDLEPIDTMGTFTAGDSEASESSSQTPEAPNGMGGGKGGRDFGGMMGTQGDFTVIGYSGDNAMTDFVSGNCSITEGVVFDENTTANECIISEELATYNNLEVGSEITLANPNNTDETFTFTVIGIYSGEQETSSGFMGGFSTATDASNKIMTSYEALKAICDASNESAEEVTDENSGMTTSTAVQGSLDYTYVFADVEAYEAFADEAAALGLSEDYTISSTDITEFENSLVPLENLSKTAGYFLLVVFIIGAVILIVINIFNIRERKYEIGVLTAIGMKKWKVASQFVTELFVVTLAAIIVGAGIGAAVSVPVTNALLSAQITSNQQTQQSMTEGFGRDTMAGGGGMTGMPTRPDSDSGEAPEMPENSGGFGGFMGNIKDSAANYISEVSYSTNLVVILQLIGVGILLTLVSSLAATLFIMRYEPLKILTNRD